MSKIADLVTQSDLGKVKVCLSDWRPSRWFQPYYRNKEGLWYGLDQEGNSNCWEGKNCWQLWQEPKKTKVVYEWRWKGPLDGRWRLDSTLRTAEDAESYYSSRSWLFEKTGRSWEVEA